MAAPNARKLEDSLTGLERLLSDALRSTLSPDEMASLESEIAAQLKPYRRNMDSKIADINNNASNSFAGAIHAALFLQEFVAESRGRDIRAACGQLITDSARAKAPGQQMASMMGFQDTV